MTPASENLSHAVSDGIATVTPNRPPMMSSTAIGSEAGAVDAADPDDGARGDRDRAFCAGAGPSAGAAALAMPGMASVA